MKFVGKILLEGTNGWYHPQGVYMENSPHSPVSLVTLGALDKIDDQFPRNVAYVKQKYK